MSRKRAFEWLTAAWLLAGCGGDGSGAAMDAGTDASTDAADTAARSNIEILRSCDVAMPCALSSAQQVETSVFHIGRDGFECLMLQLAARTPGRYEHRVNTTYSGSADTHHVFVVSDDGSVRYAPSTTLSSATDPNPTSGFAPGRRCSLKPASYYEACALASASFDGRPESDAWRCAYIEVDLWFEDCAATNTLSCE